MRLALFAAILVMFAGVSAQAADENNFAYGMCVQQALVGAIKAETDKTKIQDLVFKQLTNNQNPVYAECQAMPGASRQEFQSTFCSTLTTAQLDAELRKVPEIYKVHQYFAAHDSKEHSVLIPIMACFIQSKAIDTAQAYFESCKPTVRENRQAYADLAKGGGIAAEDADKYVQYRAIAILEYHKCLKASDKFQ